MKPIAIYQADDKGRVHLLEAKQDNWLKRLLKRFQPVLWAVLWLLIGYVMGQIG